MPEGMDGNSVGGRPVTVAGSRRPPVGGIVGQAFEHAIASTQAVVIRSRVCPRCSIIGQCQHLNHDLGRTISRKYKLSLRAWEMLYNTLKASVVRLAGPRKSAALSHRGLDPETIVCGLHFNAMIQPRPALVGVLDARAHSPYSGGEHLHDLNQDEETDAKHSPKEPADIKRGVGDRC